MIQTQCQVYQNAQVKDDAIAPLTAAPEECQQPYAKAYTAIVHYPGRTNQSHIHVFMQPFPAQAVSVWGHILHFRMENQES